MTKISSGGGVFNSLATRRVVNKKISLLASLPALALVSVFSFAAISSSAFATASTSGNAKVEMELATAIAMKIASPNDTNPDCTAESGVTYGTANRYASSAGDDSGKMVDTFDGREGQADEINTNTSCATLSMSPNSFDSTYSDITIYTNSLTGYALTVQSAENVSPNLVNTSDSNEYIPAGVLTETNNEVPGGQNKWAYKTDGNLVTNWTAVTTSPAPIKSYATYTEGGDTTRVTYGVSTGSNPTGKYATTLTYTATMFDDANPYIDYMQDFSADNHTSDAVNTEYTLFDSRDNKQYRATKLADGNIWMTEDLKLGGDSAITLTPANSDVSSNFTLAAENTGTWCSDASATCYNQSLMLKAGAPNGYLYNWYAATAGTGTYSTSANQNATASICPKGWKLPTKDQYVALDQAYGGNGTNRSDAAQINKFMASPLDLNYTGYRNATLVYGPTSEAEYWSRSASSEAYAYYLRFNSGSEHFYPHDNYNKFYGFAVRCVAEKTTLSDITNMQDMTPAVVANTAVGASKTLTDTRGGSYTVTKLADNNIWMTQDLKLGGSSALTLTPADSNVSENYTLPAENTNSWCTDQTAACYDQSLMFKTGVPNGYLYNWYAATAGTGTYELSTGNAPASICPKGWKLPTGGVSGQFRALDIAYGGTGEDRVDNTQKNKFFSAPLNFNYTGYYLVGGSVVDPNNAAYYHSSTASPGIRAYYLIFGSGGDIRPQNTNTRYYGFAIRCVAAT